ncbi:MAG TPA: phosphoadenylyl-sulfate reductase [Beijerinckiaceae bacterium]|jgi:phosphoadenosine phosphosulfate reductase
MAAPSAELARELNDSAVGQAASARLAALREAVDGRVVFTTSFGLEDQAITHLIAEAGLDIELATLDTGRMFAETYDVWRETERRYGVRIAAFYPEREALEALVAAQGIDGFYDGVAQRHACCDVRKVQPLARALAGAGAWVTGLRGSQSQHRTQMDLVGFDAARRLVKANPIFDWSREDVAAFTRANDVPVNALHARGFPSIGCAPCTRAIQPGEDERAGRWWWETSDKECGLHVTADGRFVRAAARQGMADR